MRTLRSLEILDTMPEPAFDELVALAAQICDVPIALMTLVDEGRQWFKSARGLSVSETPRDIAFCAHAILEDGLFVVGDTHLDARFMDNPLVADDPYIRFYAGAPITSGGVKVGTLAVIDRKPRTLNELQRTALTTLGKQIESQVSLRQTVRALANREQRLGVQHDALLKLQWDKQQLTSFIVHDLKAPISSILPTADLIATDPQLPEDIRESAREIRLAANVMLRMVLDLLDIGRAEEGQLAVRFGPVHLRSLLVEVHHAARRRASGVGVHIRVAPEGGGAETTIDADADLLRRVLENLVDNALKYGARRGTVNLSARQTAEETIEITVSDDGVGIADSEKETVFDRYAQIESMDHGHASRGLGLYFARLAVEAHGGRIWVQDNEPRGAMFCIELPTRRSA